LSKTFVLDTNVLLFDPVSINKFGKNKVFVPLIVVEELDRFKKDQSENGRNARYFARLVDDLRAKGTLAKGVALENGGSLHITILTDPDDSRKYGIDLHVPDNKILANAISLREKGEEVILITKDINLRLKADALGIVSEDYETSDLTEEELYSGQRTFEITADRLSKFEQERFFGAFK
jgi:PhoH-like ATPase